MRLNRLLALFAVATMATGLTSQEPHLALEATRLQAIEPTSGCAGIVETLDDRLWFAFFDRLVWHDGRETGSVTFLDREGRESPGSLRCLAACADGGVVIGCANGLWVVAPGSNEATALAGPRIREPEAIHASADGSVWVLAASGLFRLDADRVPTPVDTPSPAHPVVGLAIDGAHVWAWNERAAFRIVWREGRSHWRQIAAHAGLRSGVAHDGRLTANDNASLLAIDETGNVITLRTSPAWNHVKRVVRGHHHWWLTDHNRLWAVPFGEAPAREVALVQQERFVQGPLQVVYVDRQGLLWFGNRGAIRRAVVRAGIENLVIDGPVREESVTAFAEVDDTVWLGTSHGTLLQFVGDNWQTVAAPWPIGGVRGDVWVGAMTADASGELIVAARRAGVWRRRDEAWLPVLQPDNNLRCLLATADGNLWISHGDAIERTAADDSSTRVELPPGNRPAIIADLAALSDGSLLVGSFRNRHALHRLTNGAMQMEPVAMEWEGASLQQILVDAAADRIWVSALNGLWSVDLATAIRANVFPTSASQWLRNVVHSDGGRFWMTQQNQLLHFDTASLVAHRLGTVHGAHPIPYVARAAMRRRNGEIWFGSQGGYTRITGTPEQAMAWPVRCSRIGIEVAGKRHADVEPSALRVQVFEDEAQLRFHCTIIDRSNERPPTWRLLLRDTIGATLTPPEPRIERLPAGTWSAFAIVPTPDGREEEVPFGTLTVVARPALWPWLVLGGAVLLGLAGWQWRSTRRRTVLAGRRLHVDAAMVAGWRRPEEILDIAHLAIAAAEDALRRTGALHATVWLVRKSDDARIAIADFGMHLPNAEERARRCLAEGYCLHDHVWLLEERPQRLACVQLRGGVVQIEMLLHGLPCLDGNTMQAIEEPCGPVLAALHKLAWLDRLEHDFVDRTSMLEAEAHDLRGALTTMRLAAFTLGRAAPETSVGALREDVGRIRSSSDRILAALDTILNQLKASQVAQLAPHDPMQVVRARIEQLDASAQQKNLRLEVATSKPVLAHLDEVLFGRVVDNILGNAIKYSPKGTRVRVECEVTERECVVHFDDEGPGFAAAERESVFLAGVVGSATPTGGETKTGLGLWIARQAMRAMHGGIWVDNRSGIGSRVSVWLPRTQRNPPADGAASN